jgi:hypothetical protein
LGDQNENNPKFEASIHTRYLEPNLGLFSF